MPTIILGVGFRFFAATVNSRINRERTPKPKPMCAECDSAHIQFVACGRRAISCTFAGGVRPIKLDVLYGTDYRPRDAPARRGSASSAKSRPRNSPGNRPRPQLQSRGHSTSPLTGGYRWFPARHVPRSVASQAG